MKLIIDIGNSFAKMAVFKDDDIVDLKVIQNNNLNKIISDVVNCDSISSAIISSVSVDPAKVKTELSCRGIKVIELHHNTPVPFINRYSSPETLGKDRIAIAAAASALYPNNNVLVIDAGTCITYDFVNSKKEFLGGGISPGLRMRLQSLNTFTSRLPLLEMPDALKEIDLVGDTTKNSILSGVFYSAFLEVKAVIKQYRKLYSPLVTIVSGGDYKYFEKLLKNNIFATPNVVVIGLKKILDFNEKI